MGKFLLGQNTQAAGTTSDLPAVDLAAVDLAAVDLAAVDRPAFPLGRTSQDFPPPQWADWLEQSNDRVDRAAAEVIRLQIAVA